MCVLGLAMDIIIIILLFHPYCVTPRKNGLIFLREFACRSLFIGSLTFINIKYILNFIHLQ